MKKQANTIPNVAFVPDAINASENAPTTDMDKPMIIPFLYPIRFSMSTPDKEDIR